MPGRDAYLDGLLGDFGRYQNGRKVWNGVTGTGGRECR
jgi:hypothetical protein